MTIKIGCDPELSIVRDGYTGRFDMYRDMEGGTIKPDHCGQVGEVNPKASLKPSKVVSNLRQLLTAVKNEYSSYKIVVGGGKQWGVSTGGHIHFSSTVVDRYDFSAQDYSWHSRSRQDSVLPITPANKLVLALDGFIGSKLQKLTNGKREDRSYNLLSKIKRKNYDGISGFEYRSAPSFITTPQLAEATLATAQRIASLWETKNTVYDEIIGRIFAGNDQSSQPRYTRRGRLRRPRRKSMKVRRSDFQLIIPTANTDAARYYRNQIRYFMSIIGNRNFNLGDERMMDYWTSAITADGNSQVAVTSDRTIALMPCQIKIVNKTDDFEDEQVIKVARFAVPEVKVYPVERNYIPWTFRLRRDQKLRPNTLYFSQNLRPFIKMARGSDYKFRFVNLNSRSGVINNAIFYNTNHSNPEIVDFISSVFDNNIRTRLRRRDAV